MKKNGGRLEAALSAAFRKKFLKKFPHAWVYKIPDTFGIGGLRPFDCIIIASGVTFCIEFKRGAIDHGTTYQEFNLNRASKNGAQSFLINEENREKTLDRMGEIINGNRKGSTKDYVDGGQIL